MNKSKPIFALSAAVSILFLVVALLLPAQVSSQGKDATEVRYTAEFSLDDLTFDKLLGYDVVGLKCGSYPDELGKPMLPSVELRIALPAGMATQGIRVVSTAQEEISGEFNVLPVQPPRKIGYSDEDITFVEPDPEIYASFHPYPPELVEFVHQADLAGQGMAIVQVRPVQYVPAEKKLTLYTSISFVIEGVGGYECSDYLSPNVSERGRRTYEQMLTGMVVNPEAVSLRTGLAMKATALNGGPFDHVIITGSLHAAWYSALVEWHNQKGLKDTVVTTDFIYANYSGTYDKQKIRNFIIDANSTWGTMYFLLGGEHETVPFEYRTYYAGESTPSDQYYSDFDDDWTSEVFVGRVTAETGFEIQTFVFKLLKYEKDPPRTDYLLNALLIGMDLDDFTRSEVLKDTIANHIPPRFNVTRVYDSDPSPPHNHKTDAIAALNAGQNLVNHADHSNYNVMCTGDQNHNWCIYNSDVDNLTNMHKTSVVVSIGCLANYMDTTSDCIAEHFVIYNPNTAGVAFCGNTRDGWYSQGQPISRSGILDREWWFSLFDRDKYILGQTVADAKHHFSHSLSIMKHCEWTFNLLGEPGMPMWTDDPDSFAVTCPPTLPNGKLLCPVHVEDSTTHEPVDSAYVCLWKEGDVYLTGYTDVNGDVVFHPLPNTTGTLYATVTKHNYIPYQQTVDIPFRCGDINVPGGDGVVDVGDVVYLICYLYRGCPEPSPVEAADCNMDDVVNVADVVFLINYLYRGGPPPCDPTYPSEGR
ncbi:MAG: C25 family cysteine peptidase [Candidatus Zixiibacteriota bacterium]